MQPLNITADDEEVAPPKRKLPPALNMAKVQALPTVIAEDRAGEDAITQRVEDSAR